MSSYMRNLERHAASVAARRITTSDASTPELYVRGGKDNQLETLPDMMLRRGMCPRSGGNLSVCRKCGAPCSFGRILMEREDNGTLTDKLQARSTPATSDQIGGKSGEACGQKKGTKPQKPPESPEERRAHALKASLAAAEARKRKMAEEANKPRTPRETEEEYKRRKKNEYMRAYYHRHKDRMAAYNREYKRLVAQRKADQQEEARAADRESRAARTDLPLGETFAARLDLSMYNNGISTAEVAQELCVAESTVRRWLAGDIIPSVERLVALCWMLHLKIDWILGVEEA